VSDQLGLAGCVAIAVELLYFEREVLADELADAGSVVTSMR
jgi:hypothetical protein